MALDIEPASGNAPVVRIGLIIALAIVLQGALLWLLADRLGMRASYAMLIAFLAAIAIGYRACDHFDVHPERFRGKASPGFGLTACAGACINALVFTMMTDVFGASRWLAFSVATLVLPPALFVLANSLAGSGDERPDACWHSPARLARHLFCCGSGLHAHLSLSGTPFSMIGNSYPSGETYRQVHSNPHAYLSNMAAIGSQAAMS
ncbi:GtrA family protein [Hyphomonas sp.]|uniref:GtrA family protein n=1 Tax=Hyphomonas sp. TaxID=87 RepID=UPI003564EA2E